MRRLTIPALFIIWIVLIIFSLPDLKKIFGPLADVSRPQITLTPTLVSTSSAFLVTRVIDGDTIELSTGQKVRYIGIDTPETVDPRKPVQCFGQEAKEENKKLVEGKMVRLEKDVSETDKFGRLLRYIYVDSVFVNDYLVRNGFSYAATFPPDVKFSQQFKAAQEEARINKRGLWQSCPIK